MRIMRRLLGGAWPGECVLLVCRWLPPLSSVVDSCTSAWHAPILSLQALAGQVEEGVALHKNWSAAWNRFGWLPEMFDLGMDNRHPTETGAWAER